MVFSSIHFLFFFLPFLLFIYFLVCKFSKLGNYVLLIFSFLFYYFGEKNYIFLLLFSCFLNYILGIMIDKNRKKYLLIIGIFFNLLLLFYYKYMNFFLSNVGYFFNLNTVSLKVILPLGISFFTFQNLSYLVDVYLNDVSSQKNFFTYCTYIFLFPQLVAGPIIRYKDINYQLENRDNSISSFSDGVTRFILGLGKKVLIADSLYYSYTSILKFSSMSVLLYWIVAILFLLQIYYDFSGYSDMAIGLGRMFGFQFKENFDYPLISSSITEFWRRWHISLSSFFRDYVYIPLGGNRGSMLKTIRNILIVWFLTGLWHGASWNFIIWGLYFCLFLILEKFVLKSFFLNKFFGHIYTFLVLIIGFVIFSITDLYELSKFLLGMFGIGVSFYNQDTVYYILNNILLIVISFLGIGPFVKNFVKGRLNKMMEMGSIVVLFFIFILCIANILSNSFHPFIYFRF